MSGVLMSIPGADFELHNSLFLVAHFHNMIIGGVLFGFFAGVAYWFPKVTGFRLNERLGKWAFWSWIVGFLLAFMPLYILGFMGATRRLYVVDPAWQPLFIVAAVGVCVIFLALTFQVLQIVVSIRQRKQRLDLTGDPWNGRTLEWATSSPPPFYNFAVIPKVEGRDAWWIAKANLSTKEGQTRASARERTLLAQICLSLSTRILKSRRSGSEWCGTCGGSLCSAQPLSSYASLCARLTSIRNIY